MRGCCGRAGLARLVASLLLLASRRCAAYAPFFADSKYAAARTWDAPRVPTGLDAAADDAVDRIVSRIAHRGEIILFHFTATGWWLTWAVNF